MTIRVVHYLNQFFAGIGGEEKANAPPAVVEGPLGQGRLLQQALGGAGDVVATWTCGDNYINEETEAALADFRAVLRRFRPDVVVAGPAFGAGRYGLACGEVCRTAHRAGIPAVTAMHPENPGVDQHRRNAYILPSQETPADAARAMATLARFAEKLATGQTIGPASEEGYLPRGIRRLARAPEPGYRRAVDMLAAKVHGRPFQTEVPLLAPERVRPALPLADPARAVIALVTTGGLIPRGNPERQVAGNPDRYFKYSVAGIQHLDRAHWEAFHSGYFNETASENPNYVLPLEQARILEREGAIGSVYPWIFTLPGVGTPVVKARRLGSEIARELVSGGVDGCLLVAT